MSEPGPVPAGDFVGDDERRATEAADPRAHLAAVAVLRRGDGTRLAHGTETRVWARYVNGPGTPIKSQPIPDEVKDLFRAKQ